MPEKLAQTCISIVNHNDNCMNQDRINEKVMNGIVIVDGRNLYSSVELEELGCILTKKR